MTAPFPRRSGNKHVSYWVYGEFFKLQRSKGVLLQSFSIDGVQPVSLTNETGHTLNHFERVKTGNASLLVCLPEMLLQAWK